MIQQIQGFPCACGCAQEVTPHEGKGRPEQYFSPACRVRAHRKRKSDVTKIEMDVTKIRNTIIQGDALAILSSIPTGLVQCCITSPPYYGLRDYGVAGQIGLEETPEMYIENLLKVFREVRRVLRPDGTLWLNMGDSYSSGSVGRVDSWNVCSIDGRKVTAKQQGKPRFREVAAGFKPKDLMMIPARLVIALQQDGWYLRSDIIWHKTNAMPESVGDRPTNAHEHLFLLAKSERYFYDATAIREPAQEWAGSAGTFARQGGKNTKLSIPGQTYASHRDNREDRVPPGRNKRNVWAIASQPYAGAHFAVMPSKLIEPCIQAGSAFQACERCGMPWKPIIVKGPKAPEPEDRSPHKRLEPGQASSLSHGNIGFRASRLSGQELAEWQALHPDRCDGYQPSCTCSETKGTGRCVVLDPFAGSGTTLAVAKQFGRDYLGIELNPEYISLAHDRLDSAQPSLWQQEA